MFTCQEKEDFAVRDGKSFFWASADDVLLTGTFLDVLMVTVNDLELFLTTIICNSNATALTWQLYTDTEFTPNAPEDINSRNGNVTKPAPVACYTNPTIDSLGAPVFPIPRLISGQPAPGNESKIYEELLTGGYIPKSGAPMHLRFFNDSGVTCSVQILMSGRENI